MYWLPVKSGEDVVPVRVTTLGEVDEDPEEAEPEEEDESED